jgi:hypothetical protein
MFKSKTYFEQVSLEEVTRIVNLEMHGATAMGSPNVNPKSPKIHLFDIFRIQADGEPLWLDSALDMEEAGDLATKLMAKVPGQYFVFNQKTQEKIFVGPDEDASLRNQNHPYPHPQI